MVNPMRTSIVLLTLLLLTLPLGCEDSPASTDTSTADILDVETGEDSGPVCGAVVCGEGELCCRDRCINPRSDATHCGACEQPCLRDEACLQGTCGRACEDGCRVGELCAEGLCVTQCPEGTTGCGENCVDTASNTLHCGACDQACTAPTNLCSRGACVSGCDVAELSCGGRCVRPESDHEHCGSCGNTCGADAVCALGQCTSACPEHLSDCGGRCVDLRSAHAHCGACGSPCDAEVCVSGACIPECPAGLSDCGGHCVDVTADPAHCGSCGLSCQAGAICVSGACGVRCDAPRSQCNGLCLDTSSHREHCGGCGQACAAQQACEAGACDCDEGYDDCNGEAVDGCEAALERDDAHCGGCGSSCDAQNTRCGEGVCVCTEGFADCDEDPSNGCEAEVEACVCSPGALEFCYTGPEDTRKKGICTDGTRQCEASGLAWGTCEGEKLPALEICDNGIDESCSGTADDGNDLDGDGWLSCDGGDCCDQLSDGCSEPAEVGPGAYDFPGNNADEDCDGTPDNPVIADCSPAKNVGLVSAEDLARAMELCDFTNGDPVAPGVISAELTLAHGSSIPSNVQVGVLDDFGLLVPPQENATMAVLSSGTARDAGDNDYTHPQDNAFFDFTSVVSAPAAYLAANGGEVATAPGCPSGQTSAGATNVYDSVRLALTIRVPQNARGIAFDFRFFSAEYPEFLCSKYNDFFLALLDTGAAGVPADRNISTDALDKPISVNNLLFTTCTAQPCGFTPFQGADTDGDGCPDSQVCDGDTLCSTDPGGSVCPDSATELAGFMSETDDAGATAWLTTRAPVLPGEEITLELFIWDSFDHALDSTVLLDHVRWLESSPVVSTDDGDP